MLLIFEVGNGLLLRRIIIIRLIVRKSVRRRFRLVFRVRCLFCIVCLLLDVRFVIGLLLFDGLKLIRLFDLSMMLFRILIR